MAVTHDRDSRPGVTHGRESRLSTVTPCQESDRDSPAAIRVGWGRAGGGGGRLAAEEKLERGGVDEPLQRGRVAVAEAGHAERGRERRQAPAVRRRHQQRLQRAVPRVLRGGKGPFDKGIR